MAGSAALVLACACASVESDWAEAERRDTRAGFEQFIRAHPKSPRQDEARARIAALEWREAVARNDARTYRDFIARWPQSPFVPEARSKLAALELARLPDPATVQAEAWAHAERSNDIVAYAGFRRRFPESPYAELARKRIQALEWDRRKDLPQTAAGWAFLRENPDFDRMEEVRAGLEARATAAFEEARTKATVFAYERFVLDHPGSRLVPDARARIAWAQAHRAEIRLSAPKSVKCQRVQSDKCSWAYAVEIAERKGIGLKESSRGHQFVDGYGNRWADQALNRSGWPKEEVLNNAPGRGSKYNVSVRSACSGPADLRRFEFFFIAFDANGNHHSETVATALECESGK